MFSGIPLFPVQASTVAPDVDRLYFLIIAVTSFFALGTVIAVAIFAIKYRDDSGEVGAQSRLYSARSGCPIIPSSSRGDLLHHLVFFGSGRPPARREMTRPATADVALQHVDGKANQRAAPQGRAVR